MADLGNNIMTWGFSGNIEDSRTKDVIGVYWTQDFLKHKRN